MSNRCSDLSANGWVRVPAFVDLHVHFREPGYPEKETILSGARAAAAGGYRAVCMMPNTRPAIDCVATLRDVDRLGRAAGRLGAVGEAGEAGVTGGAGMAGGVTEVVGGVTEATGGAGKSGVAVATGGAGETGGAEATGVTGETGVAVATGVAGETGVGVLAVSAMTIGQAGAELVDLGAMDAAETRCRELTGHGVCGVSEDGKSLADPVLMEEVCRQAARLGLVVMDHAEPEAEIIARDIALALRTGARIHIQHVSLAESVRRIRAAKAAGAPVTCETAPHYIALTEEAFRAQGADAKMNPPLSQERDRLALIEGLCDGTIDCIATDHAPHEAAAKAGPVSGAANGIVGLETAFPVCYTVLVKGGYLTLDDLVRLMATRPAEIIGLPPAEDSYVFVDLAAEYRIDRNAFCTKGRNTPFHGMPVCGRVMQTVVEGTVVYAFAARTLAEKKVN
jgi:dihydroorotase